MLSFYVNISWPWFASEFFKTDSSPSAYISWLSQPHISINTSALHLQVLIYPFNIIHTKVTIMDNIKEQFTFHTTSSISAVYLSTVNFMYDNARNLSITTLDLHQRIFLLTWSHTEFNGVWIWMQIQLHNCFFFFFGSQCSTVERLEATATFQCLYQPQQHHSGCTTMQSC